MWCQVADYRRQHANDWDRDNEAGPTIPVVGGRDEGEQKLPEDSEEVHDVVKTGGQLLLATFIIIIVITWTGEGGRVRVKLTGKQKLGWGQFLPELTVMASTNCSLQVLVPITRARLVFFRSLSTVLCKTTSQSIKKCFKETNLFYYSETESDLTLNSYDSSMTTSSLTCSPSVGLPISAILLSSFSFFVKTSSSSSSETDTQRDNGLMDGVTVGHIDRWMDSADGWLDRWVEGGMDVWRIDHPSIRRTDGMNGQTED